MVEGWLGIGQEACPESDFAPNHPSTTLCAVPLPFREDVVCPRHIALNHRLRPDLDISGRSGRAASPDPLDLLGRRVGGSARIRAAQVLGDERSGIRVEPREDRALAAPSPHALSDRKQRGPALSSRPPSVHGGNYRETRTLSLVMPSGVFSVMK